jgi:hypothetical protein
LVCTNRLDGLILDNYPYIKITTDICGVATLLAKEPSYDDTLICLEYPLDLLEESPMLAMTDLQKVIN